jgi:hypothetical protein
MVELAHLMLKASRANRSTAVIPATLRQHLELELWLWRQFLSCSSRKSCHLTAHEMTKWTTR